MYNVYRNTNLHLFFFFLNTAKEKKPKCVFWIKVEVVYQESTESSVRFKLEKDKRRKVKMKLVTFT